MRKIVTLVSSILLASSTAQAFEDRRSFMPENDLHLQPSFAGGISQEQFNAVIDRAIQVYGPIFQEFGAKFEVERLWNDDTVNAYADQSGNTWKVHMFGGLARRAEVTEDGFAMVLCHEMGHHLAGYPFVQDWAADEGQSDMHATGACAYKLFGTNMELSAEAEVALPQEMKDKCDKNHEEKDRDVCYRALVAGKSLGDLLAALGGGTVSFDTPDTKVVKRTDHKHPAAQCRLDTYVAGAMCGNAKWDYKLIPGKNLTNRNSMDAQAEAYAHSCETGDGARPRCWFAPISSNTPAPQECPFGDQSICDVLCRFNPSQPWCN